MFECHSTMWTGIDDRVLTAAGGWFSPRFLFRVLSAYRQLIKAHRKIPPYDVMLIGYPGVFDTFLGRLLSWRRRAPLILDHYMSLYLISEERGLTKRSRFSGLFIRFLEGLGLRIPNLILSDTKDYIDYHCDTYKLQRKRFALAPAGADDTIFYPREELKPPSDKFRLIYHGTFIRNHGVPAMIKALNIMVDQDNVVFDMFGDGPEKSEAEILANGLRLSNIRFHGWVSGEKLAQEIAKSHLCFGAFGETKQSMITIQNKIWESMAVGRPVISGDGPAVRRILNHREDIYLVDRSDPSSIAAGIDELKSDSPLREQIAKAGYRRAREHSISSIGSSIVAAISSLTSS